MGVLDPSMMTELVSGNATYPPSPDQGGMSPVVENAPQSKPSGGGLRGFLATAFKNFMSGAGEAGEEAAGINDAAVKKSQANHYDVLSEEARQRMKLTADTIPVQMPNGAVINLPAKLATDIFKAQIGTQGKVDAAKINAESRTAADQLNANLRGLGLGVEVGFDDNGNFSWKNIPKENLPATVAAKTAAKPNEISLIVAAQNGDPEAKKTLDTLQGNRMALVRARGDAFGQARLYSLQRVYDPASGETKLMTGFDVLSAQENGQTLIPAGGLSQKEIISAQQLTSEAKPAIEGVRKHIKAFDNANDRAIFARVMEGAGKPAYGQEAGWMGSVLNQALKENLSPEGQQQAMALARLAETMGRMRSTLGLPATDQSMAVTLALLPGKSTPNSQYATGQVDQIEEMIKQAVGIPAYGMNYDQQQKKTPQVVRDKMTQSKSGLKIKRDANGRIIGVE